MGDPWRGLDRYLLKQPPEGLYLQKTMLRITIELLPNGNEEMASKIGTGKVWNDRTGNHFQGNYRGIFEWKNHITGQPMKSRRTLRGHERAHGPWKLLHAILEPGLEDGLIYPHEENPAEEKDPDAEVCVSEEELLQLEEKQAEAGLSQKDRMAGGIPGVEKEPWVESYLRRVCEQGEDRGERELAPPAGPQDQGGAPDHHPGVRSAMPQEDPRGTELGDGEGVPSPGVSDNESFMKLLEEHQTPNR